MKDSDPNPAQAAVLPLPPRPRLLVVDDEPINIRTLHKIFREDHDVLMATDGHKALELCRTDPPDLVLLDVMMPGLDGLEVCRRLQSEEETRGIPVIFVTAQESAEEETRGLEVGAVDFISKPVNPPVVRARVRTHLTLKAQADALRSLASLDGLTGVLNRRVLEERLATEIRAAARNDACLAVLMIDVDHFKAFNDHYGHQAGDACLRAVAKALGGGIRRPRDLVARYGGEEFTCVLPETELAGARDKAESLLNAVRQLAIPHEASETAGIVTISVGAAAGVPQSGSSVASYLEAADGCLYQAKASGRNRVEARGLATASTVA